MGRGHCEFPTVKEAIFSTAASLFIRRGIAGTSLGDIAAAAHLSKGTLYYYYPAKDELILAVAEDCLEGMTDILLSWVDGLGRDDDLGAVTAGLMGKLMGDERRTGLYAAICADCAARESVIRDTVAQYRQKWKLLLELGALRVRPGREELLEERSELFLLLLSGCAVQRSSGGCGLSPETLAGTVVKE